MKNMVASLPIFLSPAQKTTGAGFRHDEWARAFPVTTVADTFTVTFITVTVDVTTPPAKKTAGVTGRVMRG